MCVRSTDECVSRVLRLPFHAIHNHTPTAEDLKKWDRRVRGYTLEQFLIDAKMSLEEGMQALKVCVCVCVVCCAMCYVLCVVCCVLCVVCCVLCVVCCVVCCVLCCVLCCVVW